MPSTRSRPLTVAPPLSPPLRADGQLRFIDADGVTWAPREVVFDHRPGAPAPARLIFTSRKSVRYVSVFPADWATLSTEALIALSHGG